MGRNITVIVGGMSMTKQIEERVAVLEAEVERLKSKLETGVPWWERIAGAFANDPTYDVAMRLGREYRNSSEEPVEDPQEK